jgi:hypothetical protein
MMKNILLLLTLFVLLLSSCAGSANPTLLPATPENPADIKPTYSGDPIFTPSGEVIIPSTTPMPDVENDLVYQAKLDLSERLGISIEAIDLIRFEEVTWRNGSLGCPKPGMMYTQALVNGTLIVLRVQGTEYEYHSGGLGNPFYCPDPEPPLDGDVGDY